jgi:methylglutaconyl-CoA hydratase
MTENDIVKLHIDDFGVAHVTLNRPDVHNAFDENVIAKLTEIWERLDDMDDVIAVILRGEGKSFSAGADLNWMKRAAGYSEAQNKEDALALANMLHKLYALPKLTIAAVQGAAMGGGMGLVCCCDIVIAADDAKFALSEVKLGLIPATIAPYVIAALGARHSRRYFQSGERISAAKAYDISLAHELCPASQLDDKIDELLRNIKSNGPQAMVASKQLCLDLAGREITHDMLDDTATRISQTRAGEEAKEGLTAFLEKRKPVWIK